ncbi:MAG: signal peptidase I, partial [Actinomycetota bacterium]
AVPERTTVPTISAKPRSAPRRAKALGYAVLFAAACMLWYFALATLIVSRGTALFSGWEVSTVATGSMQPALNIGDLVAYEPADVADLQPGRIIVFDNPASPGATLVHRLVAVNSDGTLTTKGDANGQSDSTPVPVDSLKGVVTMVSPFGGYPTMLLHTGQHLRLAALIGLLLLAAIVVNAPAPIRAARGRRRRRTAPLVVPLHR